MSKLSNDFFQVLGDVSKISFLETFCKRAKEYGLSLEEYLVVIQDEISDRVGEIKGTNREVASKPKRAKPAFKTNDNNCPDCRGRLKKVEVNKTKCTKVGGNYTHILMCLNPKCRYTHLVGGE